MSTVYRRAHVRHESPRFDTIRHEFDTISTRSPEAQLEFETTDLWGLAAWIPAYTSQSQPQRAVGQRPLNSYNVQKNGDH